MPWPWAFLGSRFWITLTIKSFLKLTVEADLSVFLQRVKESFLSIRKHCLAKKHSNNSAFFFKSVTYLHWWKRGVIQAVFLWFNNVFKIDQQIFVLVIESISFLEIQSDVFLWGKKTTTPKIDTPAHIKNSRKCDSNFYGSISGNPQSSTIRSALQNLQY